MKLAKKRSSKRWLALIVGGFLSVGLVIHLAFASNQPAGASAPSSAISNMALDYFFPIDGYTFAIGSELSVFENAVENKSISSCMRSKGFNPPSPAPVIPIQDSLEFPNLKYIESHGFVVSIPAKDIPNPTKGMSSAETAAYKRVFQHCSQSASNAFTSLMNAGYVLQGEWMNIVSQIDQSPKVQVAINKWSACMRARGVDVSSLPDFFSSLDSLSRKATSDHAEMSVATSFVKCIAPAESLRVQMRRVALARFFQQHSQEVAALRSIANRVITQLSENFHVEIHK
jgi:hypothetical protein